MTAPAAIAVEQPAPSFVLKAADGSTVNLADFRGKTTVLYFYPKDDTPGCTKEACSFQNELTAFTRLNAVVLGVSGDEMDAHQRFSQKYRLTFPLLSDPDHAVAKAYGVYQQKAMYGRTYWGIERTTFVIDAQGRIAAIFPNVKVDGHTEEVLETVRQASSAAPERSRAPQSRQAR